MLVLALSALIGHCFSGSVSGGQILDNCNISEGQADHCLECMEDESYIWDCSICEAGFYVVENKDKVGRCATCDTGYKFCTVCDESKCTECIEGMELGPNATWGCGHTYDCAQEGIGLNNCGECEFDGEMSNWTTETWVWKCLDGEGAEELYCDIASSGFANCASCTDTLGYWQCAKCHEGYFLNTIDSQGKVKLCDKCTPYCKACARSPSGCDTCDTGFELIDKDDKQGCYKTTKCGLVGISDCETCEMDLGASTQYEYVWVCMDDQVEEGLSAGATAGIAVSVVVVIGAIAGVLVFFLVYKKGLMPCKKDE